MFPDMVLGARLSSVDFICHNAPMTLLVAIACFVAGGVCLTRPRRIVEWIIEKAARARGKDAPVSDAADNPGLLLFIRVIGFLSLINGVMMLYIASIPLTPS